MSQHNRIENLFAAFSRFLSEEWTSERLPYKFLTSFQDAQNAPSSDTSNIFVNVSHKAWLAYFVVKPGTARAKGHSELRKDFEALDQLPEEEIRRLAERVNSVSNIHPKVLEIVELIDRKAAMATLVEPVEDPTPSPSLKRHCTENHNIGHTQPPPYKRVASNDQPQTYHNIPHTATDSIEETSHHEGASGADVNELDLFPEYFSGCIRRDDAGDHKTAAISMNFPPHSIANVDCAMSIEVLPNKVERLAQLLYNAHLETNGKLRELVNPGGLKAIVQRLQGAHPDAVLSVFGQTTADALQSAPYREIEVQDAGPRAPTRCVTMSECHDATKGAIITLTLGRRGASQIFEKLFKSRIRSRYAV